MIGEKNTICSPIVQSQMKLSLLLQQLQRLWLSAYTDRSAPCNCMSHAMALSGMVRALSCMCAAPAYLHASIPREQERDLHLQQQKQQKHFEKRCLAISRWITNNCHCLASCWVAAAQSVWTGAALRATTGPQETW